MLAAQHSRPWTRFLTSVGDFSVSLSLSPQFLEETVEVVRLVPQKQVQVIDEEIVEVPQERDQERLAAPRVAIPVPPMMEEIAAVVPVTTHERDHEHCVEQVMDFLVPLMRKEIVKVLQP